MRGRYQYKMEMRHTNGGFGVFSVSSFAPFALRPEVYNISPSSTRLKQAQVCVPKYSSFRSRPKQKRTAGLNDIPFLQRTDQGFHVQTPFLRCI